MSEDGDLEAIAGLLEDETARAILAETSVEPMTVKDLTAHVDASKPTIYRRLEALQEQDLVRARILPDVDGHQERVYRATFDRLTVELADGTYSFEVHRQERMADRLARFIDEL